MKSNLQSTKGLERACAVLLAGVLLAGCWVRAERRPQYGNQQPRREERHENDRDRGRGHDQHDQHDQH